MNDILSSFLDLNKYVLTLEIFLQLFKALKFCTGTAFQTNPQTAFEVTGKLGSYSSRR